MPSAIESAKKAVSGAKGKAGGGISTNQTPDTLKSVWMTGPEKAKTVIDNYGKSLDQTFTQFKNREIKHITTMWENAKGSGKGLFSDFLSAIDLKKITGVDLSMDTIKGWIDNTKGYIDTANEGLAVVKLIKNGQYDAAIAKLSPILGDGLTKIATDVSGVYKVVKNADFHSVTGINSFIKNLTGIDVLKDTGILETQSKVLALLSAAQKIGFHDGIEKLKSQINGLTGLQKPLSRGLGVNARYGQIDTMYEVLTIIDGNAAYMANPQIIQTTLRNYRFPLGYKSDQLETHKTRLLEVLNKLNPNWDKEVVDGDEMLLIEPWISASYDARTIFSQDEKYRDVVAIAGSYRSRNLNEMLNEMYPYLRLAS